MIVLSTPVYFYQMNAQMKTLIDRTMACYYDERLSGKAFYFIVTAAEDKPALERTMDGLRGLTDCIPDAKVCGCIYGANAWQLGDIQGNPALHDGYTSALKAPVRCFGNHLSEKRKSLFRTENECGGAAILKNRTSRMGTPVGC